MVYTSIPANGDAIGKSLLVAESVTQLVCFISVGLRIWARERMRKQYRLDDYLIFVATFIAVGITICHFVSVAIGGLGLPANQVSMDSVELSLKLIIPAEIFWSVSNTLVKLSFLAFFQSIFSLDTYRKRFLVVGAICVGLGVASVIQTLAICVPIQYNWDKTIPNGHCGEQFISITAIAVLNFLTDVCIFALPVPIIWSLQLPTNKRRTLILTFCLGIFITCITVLRVAFSIQLVADQSNATYWVGILAIFLQFEPVLSIIAACIPVWLPLTRKRVRDRFTAQYPSGGSVGVAPKPTGDRYIALSDVSVGADRASRIGTKTHVESFGENSTEQLTTTQAGSDGIVVTTDVEVIHEVNEQLGPQPGTAM